MSQLQSCKIVCKIVHTCESVNNNLCGKLVSSLVSHFIKDLKLLQQHFLYPILIYWVVN